MGFAIGDIQIDDPVFLAPMSGISDLPFRKLVKRFGAGLVFSEMIASRSMLHETGSIRASEDYAEEFPMAVQLAGCEPDVMAEAAKMNVDRGAAIIDINFGCPVKKIVKKMGGSALMREVELAVSIMEATVKAVHVPVTVKMRLGWDEHSLNAPELARRAQDVGIQMVTVHGRTRQQMYKGTADWAAIKAVRDAIDLPLIVNGDIGNAAEARDAMRLSGADGIMVGRACQGRPWLIKQIIDDLAGKAAANDDMPLEALKVLMLEHFDAMMDYYGPEKGVPIARKHLAWYVTGLDSANDFRRAINKERNLDVVKSMILNL